MYIYSVATLIGIIILAAFFSLITTYLRLSQTYRMAHGAPHHDGYYKLGAVGQPKFRLLVLGDSIGAGQGIAEFKDSVGARVAQKLAEKYRVIYVNRAGLGKWISDILSDQIEGDWDLILQITASNDVLHGIDTARFEQDCLKLAKNMRQHSDKVVIAGPGDAASLTIFPWWFRRILKKRERQVADSFRRAAASVDAAFVDTMHEPKLTQNIGPDSLHLNSIGDEILYNCIWEKVVERGWFKEIDEPK